MPRPDRSWAIRRAGVSGAGGRAARGLLNARGITRRVVTQDDEVAARARRKIRVRDGCIVVDVATGSPG